MLNFDGFLPARASLMMDVVFVAMFMVLPILLGSILLVRYQRQYRIHKRVQLVLAVVLLFAVTLFEVEVRVYGWRERAAPSPYFDDVAEPNAVQTFFYRTMLGRANVPGLVFSVLTVHLFFAITTPVLWIYVTVQALRKFGDPPVPNRHSRQHRFWGWLAAVDMGFTALTGWAFYWMAFVAT